MRYIVVILSILLFPSIISAQSNLSVELLSGGLNTTLVESTGQSSYNINFNYIVEPGALISFQLYSDAPRYSIKFLQGIYQNRLKSFSGFTSVQLKYELFQVYKHNLNISIGPTLHYSSDSSGIITEPLLQLNNTNFKAAWLSGELEYNYYLNPKVDLSINLNNVGIKTIGLVAGFRFWFSKTGNKPCNCGSGKIKPRR